MAMNEVTGRPGLGDDFAAIGEDVPPLSRMAILAMILGLVSFLAVLSTVLLPVCIVAIGLSAVTLWTTHRDPNVRGSKFAQIGLGLSVASMFWSITAMNGHHDYLYRVAGQHAKQFLDVLSAGRKYEALELLRPEPERKVIGTNLEQYYEQADVEVRDAAQSFLFDDATQFVIAQGPDAEWEFVRGIEVKEIRSSAQIIVEMRNTNAAGKRDRVWVTLQRKLGQLVQDDDEPTALWNVAEVKFPSE